MWLRRGLVLDRLLVVQPASQPARLCCFVVWEANSTSGFGQWLWVMHVKSFSVVTHITLRADSHSVAALASQTQV